MTWLSAVVEECTRQGLELMRLDDALELHEPVALGERLGSDRDARRVSSWGHGGDLSTWSGPAVAGLAFAQRAAELAVLRAGAGAGPAAVRELLALQSSDWAFMVSRGLAVPYARERFEGHRDALARALAEGPRADVTPLRSLAIDADPALLLAP